MRGVEAVLAPGAEGFSVEGQGEGDEVAVVEDLLVEIGELIE